ncbi:MAG: low specificity L-threonine aldolase [Myxococcota bacterium]
MRVDLRSDTVTQPTIAMKQAMVDAPLGDDVYGEDPTVNRLEAIAAERAGMESALFVPSGTMGNQIALRILTQPGDEVLAHADSHPLNCEAGGAAVIAGVQIRGLAGRHGLLSGPTVRAAIRPADPHIAPVSLLTIEDTTNRGGGAVYPMPALTDLTELANEAGIRIHMDGARVWNAVVASGVSLGRRLHGIDTLSFCLSKGLGCPAGAVLCGPRDLIYTARRVRKMLGGGMRQSGMLAAAGLHALDHHVERLQDDHRRAATLATGLQGLGLHVETPQTNLVFASGISDPRGLVEFAQEHGVKFGVVGPDAVRLAVHLDVDDAGVAHAIDVIKRGLEA